VSPQAVLSLGSNLGDRAAHLHDAIAALGDAVVTVSGVYETEPWGDADQPHYLNAVALVLGPAGAGREHWLGLVRDLEHKAGRERDPDRRYGPRTLDVDVIAVWDAAGAPVLADEPDLVLPHPRAHLRAFVLRPWLDIQPYADLPGHGRVLDLVRADPVAGDLSGLRARDDISLET
jgi:2-amino-4-hydroxy-6-hydroxymethyldihydropteridine diphosphokinase